jgi:hypothetical protein
MSKKRGGKRISGNPARRGTPPSAEGRQDRFRETPEQFERRLRRDRVLGLSGLAGALVVLLLNLIMEFDNSVQLLPGGHSEFYFVAGLAGAAVSAWIAFDLGSDRRVRR